MVEQDPDQVEAAMAAYDDDEDDERLAMAVGAHRHRNCRAFETWGGEDEFFYQWAVARRHKA